MTSLATANSEEEHYEFGKNWQDFIEHNFNEDRLEISRQNLLSLLHLPDLKGKTFLDIGCGSGLHSLAAWMSGAEQITSFDYDPDSVATTGKLHALAGSPTNWTISQGDILKPDLLSHIPRHDIVYSWGVLHHTGSMWQAIRNASQFVDEGSIFCVALYTSEMYTTFSPEFWISTKRRYNRSGWLMRRLIECWYAMRFIILPELRGRRNPVKFFREYRKSRGMSVWTDVRDWLGGWPMEFAGIMETRKFFLEELGFDLEWMVTGEANTEYVFRRREDEANGAKTIEPLVHHLTCPIQHVTGQCFECAVPELMAEGDSNQDFKRSRWLLFENEEPLTIAHASKQLIETLGAGRHSHWKDRVYFSTVDGSDPRTNGRTYSLRHRPPLEILPPCRQLPAIK